MEEYLCIIRQDEDIDWYLLCVRETLYCISCGSLESIKQSIKTIKNRYHTAYGLSEALHNMSERAKCNDFTFSTRKAVYDAQKGKYDFILNEVLETVYEKVREKRKVRIPVLAKKKTTVEKVTAVVEEPSVKEKKPSIKKAFCKPVKARTV